ncbi:helix-turn-helix domain-containing protein [Streptomyces sp. NPDC001083]|uniref:helix-turn-helix domain-containing protein n=1 Tax=Streptomyces sp. NPDC001083 TaxID=3364545 RepID=UPI0036836595
MCGDQRQPDPTEDTTPSAGPARRREIPTQLPEPWRHLVAALRELQEHSGLHLHALAEVTAISKSSWQRYLNGAQFPPRHAVRALCRAAKQPSERYMTLWAQAETTWSQRGHTLPPRKTAPSGTAATTAPIAADRPTSPHDLTTSRPSGFTRRALLATSALIGDHPLAATVTVLGLCAVMLTPATALYASRASHPPAASRPPICQLTSCTGRDPRTTACEDPTTTASHTAADGTRLQIRLSPRCQAAWVRAWPTHPGFRIRLTGPGAHTQVTVESTRDEIPTTTMVAAPHPTRLQACYYPSATHPDRECFTADN